MRDLYRKIKKKKKKTKKTTRRLIYIRKKTENFKEKERKTEMY